MKHFALLSSIAVIYVAASVNATFSAEPNGSTNKVEAVTSSTAGPNDEEPTHDELRALRKGLIDTINQGDLDGLTAHLHEDVVVTWLNGEQSRGHKQVREYYDRMMRGERRIVERYSLDDVEVAELTFLFGDDAGVAYGTANSHFVLTDGSDMSIEGPWTATVVKHEDKWLVSAFHASTNMFDNPVLHMATGWIAKAAAIAGVLGLILGAVFVSFSKRVRPQPGGEATK